MSSLFSRGLLRQSTKLPGRCASRFESTSAKATEAAKDAASKVSQTASSYQSKASEGLSRVSSAAGPAISGAVTSIGNSLGKIGGRTGKLIAFVERQIPPTVYYARVGLELSKLVFHGQKMSPPPLSTFQSYFQKLVKSVRNPSALFNQAQQTTTSSTSMLQSFRNINSQQMVAGGIVVAECLGFFTVGEMIGRFKLVGYHGDAGAAHH